MLIFSSIFGIFGSVYLAAKHKEKFLAELKSQASKTRQFFYFVPVLVALPVGLFYFGLPLEITLVSLLLLIFPLLYLILKSVENACMYKHVAPHKLVEGDWIAEDICVGNYMHKPAKSGIEKKDIDKLVELEKQGKLKSVLVKDGLPHIPGMLAGLLISIFYGDLMFAIIMGSLA